MYNPASVSALLMFLIYPDDLVCAVALTSLENTYKLNMVQAAKKSIQMYF